MKLNGFIGSLVLTMCLSNTSFGFDLLDRMIGMAGGGGGCASQSSCCNTGPSCGCDNGCADACCAADPSCGCDNACGCGKKRGGLFSGMRRNKCNASCGCDVDCCDPCGCADSGRRGRRGNCGCDNGCNNGCDNGCNNGCAAPSCGCDTSCCETSCCKKKRSGGLLKKLFGCRNKCKPSCGCDASCADPCGCASNGCGNGYGSGCASGCGCGSAVHSNGMPVPAPVTPSADDAPMPPAPVVDPSASVPSKRRVVHASTLIR